MSNMSMYQTYDPVSMNYARDWFIDTWDAINAKRGFDWIANPWVWVISFKRL